MSGRLLHIANVESWSDLAKCDHMLVYLNALTWTHSPEELAAEIREAGRVGLHLQPCHEFPSVVDTDSSRHALEFKQVMDSTPADLKKWPTNIYSQIAISLKGGELREPGLANLAARLAVRIPLKPAAVESVRVPLKPATVESAAVGRLSRGRSLRLLLQSRRTSQTPRKPRTPRTPKVPPNSDVTVGSVKPGECEDRKSRRLCSCRFSKRPQK